MRRIISKNFFFCFVHINIITVIIFTGSISTAQAQDGWKFEIVPYVWLTGIDADITAGGREASIDISSENLMDNLDVGGSFLTVTQYNRWVLWTQADYFQLDTSNRHDSRSDADFESEALFLTAAFGYQYRTFGQYSTLDVMAGARYLSLDNTINNSSGENQEFLDGIFMLRPNFQLLSWLRFNPTMSIGAGDSKLTYETQPQLQFQLTDVVVARLGYRKLYYDVDGDRDNNFDGSFSGALAGVGLEF